MAAGKKRSLERRHVLERRELRILAASIKRQSAELEQELARVRSSLDAAHENVRSIETSVRLFNSLAHFLDLLLEPDAADDVIGNLRELYARRLAVDSAHAKRWLVAQVVWIVFGRAIDILGRVMRARAGK